MKKLIYAMMAIMIATSYVTAQDNKGIYDFAVPEQNNNVEELKIMYVHKDVSTHFIAMEDILYVDISSNDIVGDIPVSNTLRVKPIKEGASGVVTIVTERYMVQYMLVYSTDISSTFSRYTIPYNDLLSFMNPEKRLTKSEMYDYCYRMFVSKNRYYDVASSAQLLRLNLNNIYTIDKYFFVDISLLNRSNIQFDIDQVRFKIEDKKQTKATNYQSIEINSLMQLSNDISFKKEWRNIYVFEKFTFPEDKVFTIEISEKQISGRTIILRISYSDILNADAFVD